MRFVAKSVPLSGRPDNWRVYDTVMASFPYDRADIGHVKQDTSQSEAEAEAFRLNNPNARPTLSEWEVEF